MTSSGGQVIKTNCTIVPPIEKNKLEQGNDKLSEMLGPAFWDTILAANGDSRILLSDDLRFRWFAQQVCDVEGVWLQPVMMHAADKQVIDGKRYYDYVGSCLEAKLEYTTFNHQFLLHNLKENNWKSTIAFEHAINALGSPTADFHSSMNVLYRFLSILWQISDVIETEKRKITYQCLSAITKNKPDNSEVIMLNIGIIVGNLLNRNSQYLKSFDNAIERWCKKHKVKAPEYQYENVNEKPRSPWESIKSMKHNLRTQCSYRALNAGLFDYKIIA